MNRMTLSDAVDILLEHEQICSVCKYEDECGGGVSGGPNGPIYPHCSNGDYEALVYDDDAIELAEEICNDV